MVSVRLTRLGPAKMQGVRDALGMGVSICDTRHSIELPLRIRLPLRRGGMGALALALMFALPGCRTEGLAFRRDDTISITSPRRHSTVRLPVLVEWRRGGVRPGGDKQSFGVFLDSIPPPPGKPLSYLARNDDACKAIAGCPDERWFEDQGVFQTTDTALRLDFIPDNRPASRRNARDLHEVTVVLLDEKNRRIGESGVWVDFFVERKGP